MGYGKLDIAVWAMADVSSTDRGQVLSLCQRDSCKGHHFSRGSWCIMYAILIPTHTVSPRVKEEVRPAERLARAQLPSDARRWQTVIPVIEELKAKARKLGLWNLFLSKVHYPEHGVPLTNLEVCLRSRLPFATHMCCSMLLWPKSWDGLGTWVLK